jgi:hypothetical protein
VELGTRNAENMKIWHAASSISAFRIPTSEFLYMSSDLCPLDISVLSPYKMFLIMPCA